MAADYSSASAIWPADVPLPSQQEHSTQDAAPLTAPRTVRGSLSGDFSQTATYRGNPGNTSSIRVFKTRSHQRTVSASLPTAIATSQTTQSVQKPASSNGSSGSRLANAFRAGLRKVPARARTTTVVSSDYVSVSMASTSNAIVGLRLAGDDTTVASNSVDGVSGFSHGEHEAGPCTSDAILPSPPATASTIDAPHSAGVPRAGYSVGYGAGFETTAATAISSSGVFRPRKRSLSVGGENSCRDFFARQIEQYGLQSLLTSPVATCYFLASVILSYSPEILLFYLEAEHFRVANFATEERRTRYAKGLYKAFISHHAPLEINISSAMRQKITQTFRSGAKVSPSIFQETQDHAYALMEQDYVSFRQRPLFQHMMAELTAAPTASGQSRKDTRALHRRAVAGVYDALAKTYGVLNLPSTKAKLVESEIPSFTKFADMDLTSTDLKVTLPAWLCRTTVRLVDTAMPSSYEEMCQYQRSSATCTADSSSQMMPPYARPTVFACNPHSMPPLAPTLASPVTPEPSTPSSSGNSSSALTAVQDNSLVKKANKQRSLQLLRFRFQNDAPGNSAEGSTAAKFRWDALWSSRRRKN